MDVTILGSIGLAHDGIAVPIPTTKVRGVFAILLLSPNQVVAIDRVVKGLWDDDSMPPDGRKTLQSYISRLRSFVRDEGCGDVVTTSAGYQLLVDPDVVDYHRFVKLANSGHAALAKGDLVSASEHFSVAVALWRGRPIADLRTAWADRVRETMVARELLPAHYSLCEVRLTEGDGQFVLDHLRQLATTLPEREDEQSVSLTMRALVTAGRAGEVTSVFDGYARRVRQDVGALPSDQLRALHDRLTAKGAPTAPAGLGNAGPSRRRARSTAPSLQLLRDNPYYTGRDDLLGQLDDLVEAAGNRNVIVSIDGAPGVGKTAFVTRWGWRRVDWFPDGMLYVDLDGYSVNDPVAPREALSVFIRALGIDEIPPTEREQVGVLRHALADQRMLVILDNARHSDHVRPILGAVSCCTVLITSRQQLSHLAYKDGLHSLTMFELDDEHSVELLARKLGRRATVDPEVVHHLATLCGHLPLALRIVGEHLASRPAVPVRTLADELTRTRRLLDVGAHGDGPHVLTLRAAFSWSINALPARSARLFRYLGLHPGPRFSVELAVVMSGETRDDTDTSLDLLIGAHLLQQDQTQRYFFHDVLHKYATDSVHSIESEEDRDAAVARMLDWYVKTARNAHAVINPDPDRIPPLPRCTAVEPSTFDTRDAALRWFAAERTNLIAVARFAAAHGKHHHAWRVIACVDVIHSRSGDRRERAQLNQLGYESAKAAGEREGEAGLLNAIGLASIGLHNYDVAERSFAASLAICTAEGNEHGHAVALHNLGRVHLGRSESKQAIDYFMKSLDVVGSGQHAMIEANNWRRIGHACRQIENYPEALAHYHRALALAAAAGVSQGPELIALARLYLDWDEPDEAIKYCRDSLDLHRQNMDRMREAETLDTMATAYLRRRDPEAITTAMRSAQYYRELHDPRGEAEALTTLGHACAALGDKAEAAVHFRAAHTLFTTVGDHRSADRVTSILKSNAERPVELPNQRISTVMEPSAGLTDTQRRTPGRDRRPR